MTGPRASLPRCNLGTGPGNPSRLGHCGRVILLVGCGGPDFTDLGNGVGVPTGTIADYAAANVNGSRFRVSLQILARPSMPHLKSAGSNATRIFTWGVIWIIHPFSRYYAPKPKRQGLRILLDAYASLLHCHPPTRSYIHWQEDTGALAVRQMGKRMVILRLLVRLYRRYGRNYRRRSPDYACQ